MYETNDQHQPQEYRTGGMKRNTINKMINSVVNTYVLPILDLPASTMPAVAERINPNNLIVQKHEDKLQVIKNSIVITGGSIASMLLGEH